MRIASSLLKGLATSVVFGVVTALLAQASMLSPLLSVLRWPFLAFLAAGFPLGYVLELLPFTERVLLAAYPQGGAPGVFAFVFFCAGITWAALFAVLWHKRRLGKVA